MDSTTKKIKLEDEIKKKRGKKGLNQQADLELLNPTPYLA
jgi:hypothetical protein